MTIESVILNHLIDWYNKVYPKRVQWLKSGILPMKIPNPIMQCSNDSFM